MANSTKKDKLKKLLYDSGAAYFLLAFIIPFVLMIFAYHTENINILWWEEGKLQFTGDRQQLVVDLWHQYFPFFRVVREKLLTGGSFLYSWENGLGTNFLALIAYYAASPLNWLSIFCNEDYLREFMVYLTAAKIGLASSFFGCFLRYTYKRNDISLVAFSVPFALCSYILGYYWNVMWLDTIAMFPLVMTGVVAMCREGKWKLYTVSLLMSLIANYYIGLFTCIFTVFMFGAAAVIECRSVKDVFVKLGLIIRSSLIGIGLGAFMLIPAYLGLKLTHSANNTFPAEREWTEKWVDIFANLISYNSPTSKEGLPNLACGMLAIALFGVFLFSAGIKLREKIAAVLMLALIVVSCNWNQLNYIWHGFHITNQIPYRYAFIFSFVLIAAAYRAYQVMTEKGIKLYQLLLLVVAPAAVFCCCYLSRRDTEQGFDINEAALKSSLIITGAYIMAFFAVKIIPLRSEKIKRAILGTALTVVVVSEMYNNSMLGVKQVGSSDYATYPTMNTEVQQFLDELDERGGEFWRAEMTSTYTLNDSALYGYRGLSQFSSSANVAVTRLCKKLGLYALEAGNRYYYRTATPVVNALFGIDYLISRVGEMKNSRAFFDEIDRISYVYLYENKYPMSLGFMMNSSAAELTEESLVNTDRDNPFETQNIIISAAAGVDNIFTPQPVQLASYEHMTSDKREYGRYDYTSHGSDYTCTATYDFAGVDGSCIYGYVDSDVVENVDIYEDGESGDQQATVNGYPIVFPIGNGFGDTTKTITLNFNKDRLSGSYKVVAYALDLAAFEEAYSNLADEQFNITEFKDTKVTGTVDALSDGVMYFSIPYEKGWSVYVDGVKAETKPLLGAMLGADVSEGHHEIVLKYCPEGFVLGMGISGSAFFFFLLFAWLDMFKKKRTPAADTAEEEKPAEMDDVSPVEIVSAAESTGSEENEDKTEAEDA